MGSARTRKIASKARFASRDEILSYRESHGGEVRNPRWRERFRGKTIGDKFKLNQDIPNISGATLSCRNITDGVKRLLAIHAVALARAG